VGCYQRALYLAGALGHRKPLFAETGKAVVDAVTNEAIAPGSFRTLRLMRILQRARFGKPPELAALSARIAEVCQAKGDLRMANHYREMEAEWQKAAGKEAGEKAARLAAGELMVEMAEGRASAPPGGAMAAASMLVDAIEAFRRAGSSREGIEKLRARLSELQAESRNEMGTFSSRVDITQSAEMAQAHVRDQPFPIAALRLAFGVPTIDPSELQKEVIRSIQEHPLIHFVDKVIVDEKGRTVAHEKGVFGKSAEEQGEILEVKMFSSAASGAWRLRASGFIEPARVQILNDHQPSFDQLWDLVRHNPFVPPGHEPIFLRGLHAGLHGDFLVASHLLVPQVENSLRQMLENRGVDVSNLYSDRTQPVKVLGALLGLEEAKLMLGESLHFEVRGHLIEKTGFDFRNKVAHGFVDEDACYSAAAISTWWLVLRLCLSFAITGGEPIPPEEKLSGNET
jgi:hypothetical protein